MCNGSVMVTFGPDEEFSAIDARDRICASGRAVSRPWGTSGIHAVGGAGKAGPESGSATAGV
jgi:hypothetical protein